MGLPVHAMVARNTSSTTVNSGVNSRVSTGAMFSMTLCFASTSQDPTMTAPIAPHGISQLLGQPLGVHPDGVEHHQREGGEHAAAERDEHVVDEQLAGEPHEVHAPAAGEPAAPDVGDADDEPQGDRQMQRGQHLGIAACREREDIGENGRGREGQRQPHAGHDVEPALPGEVAREQRQHEQAGVASVERLVTAAELKTEQRRHLDGHRRGDGEAQDDERLGACGLSPTHRRRRAR